MIALPDGSYIIQQGNKKVVYGEVCLLKGKEIEFCKNMETDYII